MEPFVLVEQASGILPAPWWFVQFFKVLGFTLHAVLMHLWYAGVLWAMYLAGRGFAPGQQASGRLLRQMPVIVAYGINLGIVPLLFLQVACAKVFYPATIYMAWFWLGIVVLLIPAYYGVYICALGFRSPKVQKSTSTPRAELPETSPPGSPPPDAPSEHGADDPSAPISQGGNTIAVSGEAIPAPMALGRMLAGWLAAGLFLGIGFLFVNGLTLMTREEVFLSAHWNAIWSRHTQAGAALGTGLNWTDPRLWPRWLMFFSLAWTTLVVWLVVDTAWRSSRPSEAYRQWVARTAWKVYTAGMVGFALFGAWYLYTWAAEVRSGMLSWPTIVLTGLTAVSPGWVWLGLVWCAREGSPPGRILATFLALGQLAVLALNATSRQIVQNLEIGRFFAVSSQPEEVQWSPLVVFLILFALGAGVLGWILVQLWKVAEARVEAGSWRN